jgi:eukaryotic-like serine/threonine-protein kinase
MSKVRVDHNVLFGLLALQTGLINQAALFTAFNTWLCDRTRSIAELLVDRGALDAERRTLLEGLVFEHLKMNGGDPEKCLAAIDAGDPAGERLARPSNSEPGAGIAEIGSDQEAPDVSVGHGPADVVDPQSLSPRSDRQMQLLAEQRVRWEHGERVLVEAEIAGGLEHPGIVPVYSVGSYPNGRPYYAMRLVRGDSLKDTVAAFHADATLKRDPGRRSLELRKLLRRFLDVCNAMEYAHSRGVLHRDLKPSNIIVGKHGETLVVDWGLAKAVGRPDPGAPSEERTLVPSSASGSAETLPGSALGTPAFMSPEQASGDLDRIGPRSDVYSLGATLYVLLTGRPPFEGDDVGVVLEAVWRGEFERPRKLDRSIDAPLEAICLKAMARSAEDRYASPRALADDIERFMADEPVTAMREPIARRIRRWGKRNRTAVTAAAAAIVVALLGNAAVLAVQTQANSDLRFANGLLSVANTRERKNNAELTASNERERARFDLAMEAIKLFHGEVSEDLLLKQSQLEGLRTKLLRGAAGFYGKLEALLKGQTDQSSRPALSKAHFELAELTATIGNKPEALAVHRKALATRRELAAGPNADASSVLDVTQSLLAMGRLSEDTGDTAGARSAYEEAKHLAETLIASNTGLADAQATLAASHDGIGSAKRKSNDTAGSLLSFREGLQILEKLADANPAANQFQRDLARSHSNIAGVQFTTGDTAGALVSYTRALAIQEELAAADAAVTEFQAARATSHNSIGRLHLWTGDIPGAMESYRRALAIWEKLTALNPAITG